MCNSVVLEKIKKLLAKANGTQNPHEAAAFLAKAQAMQLQHRISVIDLDTPKQEVSFDETPLNSEDFGKKKLASWKSNLAFILARANGVFVYVESGKLLLVGKEDGCNTLRYLYWYCINEIEALTRKFARGNGRTYALNFRFGCIKAIKQAIDKELETQRKNYQSNSKALVALDQIEAEYQQAARRARAALNLKVTSRKVSGNNEALRAGEIAGKGIYGQSRVRVGGQRLIE